MEIADSLHLLVGCGPVESAFGASLAQDRRSKPMSQKSMLALEVI